MNWSELEVTLKELTVTESREVLQASPLGELLINQLYELEYQKRLVRKAAQEVASAAERVAKEAEQLLPPEPSYSSAWERLQTRRAEMGRISNTVEQLVSTWQLTQLGK